MRPNGAFRSRRRGALICFEGVDGSGKSTLAREVAATLAEGGVALELVDKNDPPWPRNGAGDRMRNLGQILWNSPAQESVADIGPASWLFLIAAWFAELEHSCIGPRLAAGTTVVCDSWYFKYAARYRAKEHFDQALVDTAFSPLRRPDTVVWLDVAPELAARRKDTFTACECSALEGEPVPLTRESFIAFQRRVRAALLGLRDPASWLTIPDGAETPAELGRSLGLRLLPGLAAPPGSIRSAR